MHCLLKGDTAWSDKIQPAEYFPENIKIQTLLEELRAKQSHMAVIVDEYGGTQGIVTMEDILEEIVGEINDEYDEEEKSYVRINANTYVFEGKTLLTDFCKILNFDDELFEEVQGDADTLAGLMLELKGDFPSPHEVLAYQNLKFEMVEMDEHRISKIKVVTSQTQPDVPPRTMKSS